jgi:hypothetical protein
MTALDVDDDLEIPEITDWAGFERGRYARKPGETSQIFIDGAVGYSVRLIPSDKVVGRFSSTLEAWPAILAEVERGIPPKCLVLDWHGAHGERGRVSSGRLLVSIARSSLGLDIAQERVPVAS